MLKNYRKGEVYLVDFGQLDNSVQKGIRPCLVVQNNFGNTVSPNIIIVPITSKHKKLEMPVHVLIDKRNMALCECILTIPKKQTISYLRTLDSYTMKLIDVALSISLEI